MQAEARVRSAKLALGSTELVAAELDKWRKVVTGANTPRAHVAVAAYRHLGIRTRKRAMTCRGGLGQSERETLLRNRTAHRPQHELRVPDALHGGDY